MTSASWQQLHPLSHSAFLLRDGAGVGRDFLVDMGYHGESIDAVLRAHGSAVSRVTHLFITHTDPDHLEFDTAAAMARAGTDLFIGAAAVERLAPARRATLAGIASVHLLPPAGTLTVAGVDVAFATFPHGEAKPNTAYRIGDQLFSGDTPVTALLNPENPDAAVLLGLDGAVTRGLWINTAQRSRQDIRELHDVLGAARHDNYLANHGIAEDVGDRPLDPDAAGRGARSPRIRLQRRLSRRHDLSERSARIDATGSLR
jgi:glyoxylase-like metal-dependent hydrolase (beta-lactamase superfamily II)